MSKTQHTTEDFKVGEQVRDLSGIQGTVIEGAPISLVRVAFGPNGTHWRDLKQHQLTKVKTGQHTPGPWRSVEIKNDFWIHSKDSEAILANLPPLEIPTSEREANALLISLAPETAAERDRLKEVINEIRIDLNGNNIETARKRIAAIISPQS